MPITILGRENTRGMRVVYVRYTGPTSYAAGGEGVSAASLGLSLIRFVQPGIITDGTTARLAVYNTTTGKVQVFQFDYPAAAAGGAVEVPAATNLSALSGVLVFYGRP